MRPFTRGFYLLGGQFMEDRNTSQKKFMCISLLQEAVLVILNLYCHLTFILILVSILSRWNNDNLPGPPESRPSAIRLGGPNSIYPQLFPRENRDTPLQTQCGLKRFWSVFEACLKIFEIDEAFLKRFWSVPEALFWCIRNATHPHAIERRRLAAEAAAADSDDSIQIEMPPELSMDDPLMLEAVIAQRQWERLQRRRRSQLEQGDEDDDEGYDFDSEYSSEEGEDASSYDISNSDEGSLNDEEEEDDESRGVSVDASEDRDDETYRSRSSREESVAISDDNHSYDSRNDDTPATRSIAP